MSEREDINPRFKDAMINRAKDEIPYWSLLGMQVVDMKKGWSKMKVPFKENLRNANGVIHGGVIFSVADSAMGTALITLIDKNDFISTIEMKINFIKPGKGDAIIAEADIIHRGATTAIGDIHVRDSEGNLLAKGLATYAIRKGRKIKK